MVSSTITGCKTCKSLFTVCICSRVANFKTSSDVLLRTIVADWHRAFHEEIPAVRRLACDSIDTIWDAFLEQLQAGVKSVISELSPLLAKIMPDLRVIKEQVKERVKQALEGIIKNASKVHPKIIDSIQGKWTPVFQQAQLITGRSRLKFTYQAYLTYTAREWLLFEATGASS